MSLRGFLCGLLLALLALAQFAVLTLPAALVLGEQSIRQNMFWTESNANIALLCNAIAVLCALLLGLPAALALWRWRGQGVAAAILLAPLLVPTGFLAGNQNSPEAIAILLCAHASLGIGLGAGCGLAALHGVDAGLLKAAASAGIDPLRAYRRVILPLMGPGALAGMILAGTASMASSLVAMAKAPPIALASLAAAPVLAMAGVALLVCALVMAALAFLRWR
jgi:ABC-type spermidine/putrescine transport system permease subunit II